MGHDPWMYSRRDLLKTLSRFTRKKKYVGVKKFPMGSQKDIRQEAYFEGKKSLPDSIERRFTCFRKSEQLISLMNSLYIKPFLTKFVQLFRKF